MISYQDFSVMCINIWKCSDKITIFLSKINTYPIFKKSSFHTSEFVILVELDAHMVVTSTILIRSLLTTQCIGFVIELSMSNPCRTNSAKIFVSGHFSKFASLHVFIYTFLVSFPFSSVKGIVK